MDVDVVIDVDITKKATNQAMMEGTGDREGPWFLGDRGDACFRLAMIIVMMALCEESVSFAVTSPRQFLGKTESCGFKKAKTVIARKLARGS